MSGSVVSGTALALRSAFDRAFAEASRTTAAANEDLLVLRVGGTAHAILVSEILALHADRRVVPLPSAATGLLGVVGLRSGLVPVFDLATLLGYARALSPRWMFVARAAEPLGLAFELLEGHVRVDPTQVSLASQAAADAAHPFIRGAVRAAGVVRPLVHVASVVEALTRRAGGAPKDR